MKRMTEQTNCQAASKQINKHTNERTNTIESATATVTVTAANAIPSVAMSSRKSPLCGAFNKVIARTCFARRSIIVPGHPVVLVAQDNPACARQEHRNYRAIIGQEMSGTHVRWPINVTQGVTYMYSQYACMGVRQIGLFFIARGLLQKRISNFTPNGLQSLLVAYLNATPIYCQRAAISFIRIRAHCPGRVRPFPAPG